MRRQSMWCAAAFSVFLASAIWPSLGFSKTLGPDATVAQSLPNAIVVKMDTDGAGSVREVVAYPVNLQQPVVDKATAEAAVQETMLSTDAITLNPTITSTAVRAPYRWGGPYGYRGYHWNYYRPYRNYGFFGYGGYPYYNYGTYYGGYPYDYPYAYGGYGYAPSYGFYYGGYPYSYNRGNYWYRRNNAYYYTYHNPYWRWRR